VGEESSAQALSTGGVDVSGKEKKLTNQFNFSERASQTYNNPMRVRCRQLVVSRLAGA